MMLYPWPFLPAAADEPAAASMNNKVGFERFFEEIWLVVAFVAVRAAGPPW